MANTFLSTSEISYLKKAIVEKYCKITGQNDIDFIARITGAIKHYDFMADVINNYIDEEKNVQQYLNDIKESYIKISLRKWTDGNAKHRNYADKPAVSGNTLRKLIFDNHHKEGAAFKDFFILGCYIFTGIDIITPPLVVNDNPKKPLQLTPVPGGTIDIYNRMQAVDSGVFTLNILQADKPITPPTKFSYKGQPVILNRANLDIENKTITSKVQATIYFENGNWMIDNGSEFKTTQIRVTRPIAIKPGDIIMFGDQAFLFEA